MRDTSLLRARVEAVLRGAPILAPLVVGLACGAPPPPAPGPGVAPAAASPVTSPAPEAGPVEAEAIVAEAEAPRPAYPERWGMDPYDPDAEEEQGCVNGDWCGPASAARKFANESSGEELGCPARLMHRPDNGAKPTDKTYAGLSFDVMMQGRIRPVSTRSARESAGKDDVCCYHWFNYCSGRPLLGDAEDEARVAPVAEDGAWGQEVAAAPELPPGLAEHLGELWLRDARFEHASIAAFARATLELLAVGAPPNLLAGAQQAGLDEIRHAQACFGLASRYSGRPLAPGPLPALAPRELDLAGVAEVTFVEGCVGETIAALVAMRAARLCRDPAVQGVLAGIAEDEARHAELAWATVADALVRGGAPVARALRSAAERMRERSQAASPARGLWPAELLAAHGRLDAAAEAAARADAWREIIDPMLADLVVDGASRG